MLGIHIAQSRDGVGSPASKRCNNEGCYGAATHYGSMRFLGFEPPKGLHAGRPLGWSLLVRWFIMASHSHSHYIPHLHGTFSFVLGVKSSIRLVGWCHSPGR
jgi:hypothetical protein